MTLGEKLKSLRKERRWTLKEVAYKLGLNSHSTYSNWEYNRTQPDLDMIKKLSKLYEVPVDELININNKKETRIDDDLRSVLSKETNELIEKAKVNLDQLIKNAVRVLVTFSQHNKNTYDQMISGLRLNEHYSDEILYNPTLLIETLQSDYSDINILLLDFLVVFEFNKDVNKALELLDHSDPVYMTTDKSEVHKILTVPVLGRITAGEPILATENIEDYIQIPNLWNLNEGEVFVLNVKGDSMIGSRIHDGDKVVVKIQPEVENGQIAVVNVNGNDATLKKVKKINGQTILYPDNPKYDPIFITNENARIIGKVIQVMFEPGKV